MRRLRSFPSLLPAGDSRRTPLLPGVVLDWESGVVEAAGSAAAEGTVVGAIESNKSVGELFAPVSGEVLEANQAVIDAPELVNSDPFGSGWLLKVRVADASRLEDLLDAAAYAALIGDAE